MLVPETWNFQILMGGTGVCRAKSGSQNPIFYSAKFISKCRSDKNKKCANIWSDSFISIFARNQFVIIDISNKIA